MTNLKAALENKIGLWAGELRENEEQIAEIMTLFETLPERTKRAERLKRVLECAGVVMTEIDPTWTENRVKPSKPFVHKSPVEIGQIAKLTLDILRESPKPLTAREIARKVLEMKDMADPSRADLDRTANSVNASLRQKLGVVVTHDGGYPQRWKISV
jgi:hypothetical protein